MKGGGALLFSCEFRRYMPIRLKKRGEEEGKEEVEEEKKCGYMHFLSIVKMTTATFFIYFRRRFYFCIFYFVILQINRRNG